MSTVYPDSLTPTSKVREEEFAQGIEANIRPLVLHLRNCGFNTHMSCHHAMYIFIAGAPAWLEHEGHQVLRATKQWLQEHDLDDSVEMELDEDTDEIKLWLPSETRSCVEGNEKFPEGQQLRRKKNGRTDQWLRDPRNKADFEEEMGRLRRAADARLERRFGKPSLT